MISKEKIDEICLLSRRKIFPARTQKNKASLKNILSPIFNVKNKKILTNTLNEEISSEVEFA